MRSIERTAATRAPTPSLTGRLAGATLAALLIVIGLAMATRPAGGEQARAHATARTAGIVVSTQKTWDGGQSLTIVWLADFPTGHTIYTAIRIFVHPG